MTPIHLTIHIRAEDLLQFLRPAPERPQDVSVSVSWQPHSGWPVELRINPDDFHIAVEKDHPMHGKIVFRRDPTEEECEAANQRLRKMIEKDFGKLGQ